MRPSNSEIWRAANLLWAWSALSEYVPDWEQAQRFRRGARRVLAWFQYWFSSSSATLVARGKVGGSRFSDNECLYTKDEDKYDLGSWAARYVGKTLSIYVEEANDENNQAE